MTTIEPAAWFCEYCNTLVKGTEEECPNCHASKQACTWTCGQCGTENPCSAGICQACKTPILEEKDEY